MLDSYTTSEEWGFYHFLRSELFNGSYLGDLKLMQWQLEKLELILNDHEWPDLLSFLIFELCSIYTPLGRSWNIPKMRMLRGQLSKLEEL